VVSSPWCHQLRQHIYRSIGSSHTTETLALRKCKPRWQCMLPLLVKRSSYRNNMRCQTRQYLAILTRSDVHLTASPPQDGRDCLHVSFTQHVEE